MMERNYLKWLILLVVTIFIQIMNMNQSIYADETINILFVNSYHEGYKWSDDILTGIEAELDALYIQYELDIDYLDTQKIDSSTIEDYFNTQYEVLKYKCSSTQYDLIITSDDPAFLFITEYTGELFKDIPHFFCGLNNIDDINFEKMDRPITGVSEQIDIKMNVELIKSIHENVDTIHFIVDKTVTGQTVMNKVKKQVDQLTLGVNFEFVAGDYLSDLIEYVKGLSEDDVVLFGIYFQDKDYEHYNYDEVIQVLSKESPVPIYGLWNFHLDHGIIGGKLIDGYSQGLKVVDLVNQYINGSEIDSLNIIEDDIGSIRYNYEVLKKYGVELSRLPENCEIINYTAVDKPKVLLLHSYNQGLDWTDSITLGIQDTLCKREKDVDLHIEYLDLKYIDGNVYLSEYDKLLESKYHLEQFDLILTADDGALNFARQYMDLGNSNIPIVFCGVNYFDDELLKDNNIAGVIEKYDVRSNIELMIQQNPDLKEVVVINDETLTGKSNKKNVEEIMPYYKDRLEFTFLEHINMSDLEIYVSQLEASSAIMLLSFNRDKSNNFYSYDESIHMIRDNASVPIYSVWDFYLGKGIVGGLLTSGYEQGHQAGLMAISILEGEAMQNIGIVSGNTNKYMFDQKEIRKYHIDRKNIPRTATIINQGKYVDLYDKNQVLFNSIVIIIIILVVGSALQAMLLRANIDAKKRMHELATIDSLTGALNRGTGIEKLEKILNGNNAEGRSTTVGFLDINDLKPINDVFGHGEGDLIIQKCVNILSKYLYGNNFVCRMGGDEFLVVFPEMDKIKAKAILQAFRNEFEGVKDIVNKDYHFGVSFGVCESNKENPLTVDELVERADKEMYKDKSRYKKRNEI